MTERQLEELEEIRRHLLESVKAVVDQAAAVRVDTHETPAVIVLLIVTATEDVGRALGKGGHRVRTLREWARRRGTGAGLMVYVDVAGSRGGRSAESPR